MNDENKKTAIARLLLPTTMKYGLILGLILTVSDIIVYRLSLGNEKSIELYALYNILPGLLSAIGVFISIKWYRDQVISGPITFSNIFIFVIYLSFFSSIILSLGILVYYAFDPYYLINSTEVVKENLNAIYDTYYRALPNANEMRDLIDQTIKAQPHSMKDLIPSVIYNYTLILGTILGILGGLIFRKKKKIED